MKFNTYSIRKRYGLMNQKLDNILNLALDTPEEQRKKSSDLDVGYNAASKEWEVIVRYSGDPSILEQYGTIVDTLYGRYAIVLLTSSNITALAANPQIEYIEKPKKLYFEIYEGRYASCIPAVTQPPFSLTGQGTIVAVLDSGVDYSHPDFRNEDGSSRILFLWDQTRDIVYEKGQIDEALRQETPGQQYAIVPESDSSGHGTKVLGIAAGNGRASRGENIGVAPEADIIFVKLGTPRANGFPRTTELMRGVDFCIRKGVELLRPIAINISYGNNYGSHTGTSLVETYLDNVTEIGKTTIIVGTGNEGVKRRHAGGVLTGETRVEEFVLGDGIKNTNLQIWKDYSDEFQIEIVSPSGTRAVLSQNQIGTYEIVLGLTRLLWVFGEPAPYGMPQEIYVEFIPEGQASFVQSGVWKLIFTPIQIQNGTYRMWFPAGEETGDTTGFLVPDSNRTLTIPSTAVKVISVGAYDSRTDTVATFSGRGPAAGTEVKPTIVAPGVNIIAPSVGGGYSMSSGTSLAAPFVTGAVCLLNQWGIVNGNDPYLYSQKAKAYLIKGARRLPGYAEWPNNILGWGALCVRDSLPL